MPTKHRRSRPRGRPLPEAAKGPGASGTDVAEATRADVARGDTGRATRARHWQEENAAALAGYNRFIDAEGVPLAGFRKF